MDKGTITEGRIVTFFPSERTLKVFENKQKKSYPAIVTEVNDGSVDLTVFGVKETHYISNIKHVSESAPERSSWDCPKRV